MSGLATYILACDGAGCAARFTDASQSKLFRVREEAAERGWTRPGGAWQGSMPSVFQQGEEMSKDPGDLARILATQTVDDIEFLSQGTTPRPWRAMAGGISSPAARGSDAILAEAMRRQDAEFAVALVNSWPEIRDRLRREEAIPACNHRTGIKHRVHEAKRGNPTMWCGDCGALGFGDEWVLPLHTKTEETK